MTAAITEYNPQGTQTAGMSRIVLVPAIADRATLAPTVPEINAGIAIECAIDAFGPGVKPSTTERKMLCDKVAKKRLGSESYDDLPISFVLDDPQGADQKLLDKLVKGSTVFLVHRPGMAHTTAFAAAQKVQVIEAIVATRNLTALDTKEAAEYQVEATLMPQNITDIFVAVKA